MESSQLLQQDEMGFTLCPAGHRGKTTSCCQGPRFAAAAAHGDGTNSYLLLATPTEELNFKLRGVKRKVLGSGFFSDPRLDKIILFLRRHVKLQFSNTLARLCFLKPYPPNHINKVVTLSTE